MALRGTEFSDWWEYDAPQFDFSELDCTDLISDDVFFGKEFITANEPDVSEVGSLKIRTNGERGRNCRQVEELTSEKKRLSMSMDRGRDRLWLLSPSPTLQREPSLERKKDEFAKSELPSANPKSHGKGVKSQTIGETEMTIDKRKIVQSLTEKNRERVYSMPAQAAMFGSWVSEIIYKRTGVVPPKGQFENYRHNRPSKITVPAPFSFEQRTKQMMGKRDDRMHKLLETEKKPAIEPKRDFRARPFLLPQTAAQRKYMAATKICQSGPVASFVLLSPLGNLELTCCTKAVHSLNMMANASENLFSPDPSVDVVIRDPPKPNKTDSCYSVATKCVQWLQKYFHQTTNSNFQMQLPPICPLHDSSDSFTKRVWKTLADDVPFGQVVTYGELGSMSGSSEKASRAVGQAMRNNPVMILVPCHRVILSNGNIGNYSGGKWNDVKAWLLEHEKCKKIL